MNKSLTAALCAIALASTSLMAGGIQEKQVSAAAQWVVHVDVEGFVASGLGQYLVQKGKDHDLNAKIAKFKEKFGFDPLTDLKGITLYGENFDQAGGVAIVQAKVDQKAMLKLLAENKGHKELKYGDRVVHQWTQAAMPYSPAGDRFGTFYSDDVTAIAQSEEVLHHAIDVLDGKADNLTKAKISLLPKMPKGTLFVASAVDIALPKAHKPHGAMLQKISSGSIVAGEDDETLFYKSDVTAETAKDAKNIQRLIDGFVAMAGLFSERNADAAVPAPDPSPLIEGIKVTSEGQAVHVEWSAALEDVQTFIDSAINFGQAMREARKSKTQPIGSPNTGE